MNYKTTVRTALLTAGLAFITGCAPMLSGVMNAAVDETAVVDKTAKYFGVARESLTISAIEKGPLSTSYQARSAGKLYNCSIYYGAVNCSQPGSSEIASRATVPAAVVEVQSPAATINQPLTPRQAQLRLNQLGFAVGVPDGVFGKKSVEQLRNFQKSRALAVNGKLDSPTIEALR